MQIILSGGVFYSTGDPAPNVSVRIFDKDATGKEDDDLTVSPGLSDEDGRFSLTYEPLRFMDFYTLHLPGGNKTAAATQAGAHGLRLPDITDMYLPYLKFFYSFNNSIRKHTATLGLFQNDFFLPITPPVEFLPSSNGFLFRNSFSGYFLPYSTPAFMSSRKVSSVYGLCGGMCAAACDFILAGRQAPRDSEVPRQGTRLQRYLFQRQMDSLGGLGEALIKVAQWTSLPNDTPFGTMRRTADELIQIRQKLDEGNLVILALIYARATSLKKLARVIFNNHQVLAYSYQEDASGEITIHVYDPNLPAQDDVDIRCEPIPLSDGQSTPGSIPVSGFKSTQLVGGQFYREVRGFLAMPYTPVKPPKGL